MAGRRRRRPTRDHQVGQMALFLKTGRDMFGDLKGKEPTLAELREGWSVLKNELMARTRLGARPWGWWRFEAPMKAKKLKFESPYSIEDRVILKRFGLLRRTEQKAIRKDIESRWAQRNEIRVEEEDYVASQSTLPVGI